MQTLVRWEKNQLGVWIITIQNSHRLWSFYYSSNKNTIYQGYCEDWHSNIRYQFDTYQGNDEELFDFEPIDRNIDSKYMLGDTVPVDIAYAHQEVGKYANINQELDYLNHLLQ